MPIVDLVDPELSAYRSSAVPPDDLHEFWSATIAESRALASAPTLVPVSTGLRLVQTWDVTFSGFGGQPIRAWYHRPAGLDDEKLPGDVRVRGLWRGSRAGSSVGLLGRCRVRAPRHGHSGPGVVLVARRHSGPGGLGAGGSRFDDTRHHGSGDLLLPACLHGRSAGHGPGAGPGWDRSDAHRRIGREPGWRHRARGRGPDSWSGCRDGRCPLPVRLPPRRGPGADAALR